MNEKADVQFGDITEKNLGSLKILNAAIFPVKYNDKFYTDLLHSTQYSTLGGLHFSLVFCFFFCILFLHCNYPAYHNDVLVGAVCCRIEKEGGQIVSDKEFPLASPSSCKLYIMTLGVLAPYRRLGLGKSTSTLL
jgi:hypothetical protein